MYGTTITLCKIMIEEKNSLALLTKKNRPKLHHSFIP